jgi:hypothetical protein
MDEEVMSFANIKPNMSLVDEIWAFDVNNLDSLDGTTISKYVIALSQWLIYYKVQVNKARAEKNQLKADLDFLVSAWMTPKLLKEHKTQTAARDYIIRSNAESARMFDSLNKINRDLVKVDGIDKAVTEFISAFKRELTRRDNELYAIRAERR